MSNKPIFMPAPRPQGHTSNLPNAAAAKAFLEANADLGFNRHSTDQKDELVQKPLPPIEKALVVESKENKEKSEPVSTTPMSDQVLRFQVPDEVATTLKLQSVHRRVTVRYLVLEALQKAGYPVDLNEIPEDGRRNR